MSATATRSTIGEALFGKARRNVLALLFAHAGRSFYLREIAAWASVGMGPVQRELSRLTAVGLITRNRVGNQVHYQANQASPVFDELRSLMVKTAGVADVLREALAPLADQVQIAFIYGSVAQGTETSSSDIDVMLVGAVPFSAAVAALGPAEARLGREVNPTVFTPEEFGAKARQDHPFLQAVLRGPKVMLLGGEDDVRRLAQ